MHSHGVAHRFVSPSSCVMNVRIYDMHRDSSLKNILMDASRMFPRGFHPVRDVFLPHDISIPAPMIPRWNVGVKYYFTDYGISSYFPEGTEHQLVLGIAGRDRDVPELSNEVPYDPFKVDIFTIGNVLRHEFVAVRSGFLFKLILVSHPYLEIHQFRLLHTFNRSHDAE